MISTQSDLRQSPKTPVTPVHSLTNPEIADRLLECADLLETQDANPFRVMAYRNAADTLRGLDQPVDKILAAQGRPGLIRLPAIGQSLSAAIEQLSRTGRYALLEQLRGEAMGERAFATVPGIGHELAARIHDVLGIETLVELEVAAHNGSLQRVPGMGRKRIRAVRESLAGRLRLTPRGNAATANLPRDHVSVADLLAIDEEYRRLAKTNRLIRIAPRRFNPDGKAWLPILHAERDGQHYTALFSNTARAHRLGMTHDWVIIYRDDAEGDGQWTVITSHRGSLKNKRIVRGREHECERHYAKQSIRTAPPMVRTQQQLHFPAEFFTQGNTE